MSWRPDICFWHGACDDGFGAAWAIWKRWGDDVQYIPGTYGKPLPDVTGKHVLFVDFSAKREEIEKIAAVAKSIVILDHHKTAEADLLPFTMGPRMDGDPRRFTPEELSGIVQGQIDRQIPPILAWFDQQYSGAHLAWMFAHDMLPPEMLLLIEDRDLWRFAHGDKTRQFSAALRTYPMNFATWDWISTNVASLIFDGKAVLRAHDVNIEKFILDAYSHMIGGFMVPVVNVPYHYASDTAHALLQKFPDAPFTACWFKRGDGMIQWSLRSEDSRVDVSEIAKRFGGGGHRNAAGFQLRLDIEPLPAKLPAEHTPYFLQRGEPGAD